MTRLCATCLDGTCSACRRDRLNAFCRQIDGSGPGAASLGRRKNAGSDAHPPGGIDGKRRPHVHHPVYFGTPAEHNRKLLEGAIRCLTQYIERNEANPNVGRLIYHAVKIQEYAMAQESSPKKADCPCVGGHEPQGPHGKAPGR